METITIKIRNQKALRLIEDMELLELIQILSKEQQNPETRKLSEAMSGSMSHEDAEAYHRSVEKSKNEWNRNT